MTHGYINLNKSENILNTQDLYNAICLYSNTCFFHTDLELILDTLYLELQRQMSNDHDAIMIT